MNQFLALIIIISVAALLVLIKKTSNRLERIVVPVLIALLGIETVFFLVANWFTGRGVDESVIFHLRTGLSGAGFEDYYVLITWAVIGVLASLIVSYLVARRLGRLSSSHRTLPTIVLSVVVTTLLFFHPAFVGYMTAAGNPLRELNFEGSGDFSDFYRKPAIQRTKSVPNNVVVLFLESFERTFLDEELFPGLTANLNRIEKKSISFTRIEQLAWTGWTIGGLTAATCGLPLFSPSHGNYLMKGMSNFMPVATCLGDLLVEQNYSLTYLSGSSVEFAGTGKLFSSHGFETVIGLEDLIKSNPEMDTTGWGLTDDVIFSQGLKIFDRNSRASTPFGLFISSIDTHPPNGRLSDGCTNRQYQDGSNEMLNAVHCSDQVVSGFIERILASPHFDKTTLVIMSDHLILQSAATPLLADESRTNLFMILDKEKPPVTIDKIGSPLDIGPTILSSMGFEATLALGRDLLGSEQTILGQVGDFRTKMNTWHASIIQFWGFPKLTQDNRIVISARRGTIEIDGAEIKFPLLVEIGEQGDTIVRFDSPNEGYRLNDFVARAPPRKGFLWVDSCDSIKQLAPVEKDDYCIVYGYFGSKVLTVEPLTDDVTLTWDKIKASATELRPMRSPEVKQEHSRDRERVIAHAGGIIDGHTYTNTLEALEKNYRNGFRKFELDIIQTRDGNFVAAHDWPYWKKLTGYDGELPPTLDSFLDTPILGDLSPMGMDQINSWFDSHPDAILVTDKVNNPTAFVNQFIDRNRLVMELFSVEAVAEATSLKIRSAMPSENVLRQLGKNAAEKLRNMGVNEVAVSRNIINTQAELLERLRTAGIRVYVYHVGKTASRNEKFALCSDLDFVYGFYADRFNFAESPDCSVW